jgi:hypothetical protein
MQRWSAILLAATALAFIGACNGDSDSLPVVVDECEYVDIPGTATIVNVREPDPGASNCRNAGEIVFRFTPDDPTAPERYLIPDWPDTGQILTVGNGMNPPRSWVQDRGLRKGTIHRAVRREITRGTCTPVIFEFPDVDMTGWEADCF